MGQAIDRAAVADVGGGQVQRKQMAERVDSQVQLRFLLAFGAVVAGAGSAFARVEPDVEY